MTTEKDSKSVVDSEEEVKFTTILDFFGDSPHHIASQAAGLTYAAHIEDDNPELAEFIRRSVLFHQSRFST